MSVLNLNKEENDLSVALVDLHNASPENLRALAGVVALRISILSKTAILNYLKPYTRSVK